MVLMDGKKLADRMLAALKEDVAASKKNLRLAVVVVGEDPVIRHFVAEKKKIAARAGIDVCVYPFSADITTTALRGAIADIVHEKRCFSQPTTRTSDVGPTLFGGVAIRDARLW